MSAPALIVIDMQVGMSWPSSGERNNSQAEQVIVQLLSHWRDAQLSLVHVRHRSKTEGSPFWPDQPGAEFQPLLAPTASEHIVEKEVPDAFVNTGLERWLRARAIASLVIVGVSTNNSVESTVRSAGNLGFKTFVVADGCFAFAKNDFYGRRRSADEVHAMSLANLHGEYAEVIQSQQAFQLAIAK